MLSQTLYKTTSKGKVMTWYIEVKVQDTKVYMTSYSGYIDGKIKVSPREITKGKNLKSINKTTPLEQACKEAQSKWNYKKDRCGMTLTPGEISQFIGPMLAKNYLKDKNKIKFPCYVQKKYDGVRFIYNVEKKMGYTRQRQILHLPKLDKCISRINKHIYLDGELYKHSADFSEIQGNVSKNELKDMKYYIYDCFDIQNTNWMFKDRITYLHKIPVDNLLVIVPTDLVEDEEQMMIYFNKFIEAKYEGIILRNTDSLYKVNFRSNDLQKFKLMEDAEFKIIDAKEAKGTHKGCVIFKCQINDKTFWTKMAGPLANSRRMFIDKDQYIGQMLTVKYQELSHKGIPRFPVGKAIRN